MSACRGGAVDIRTRRRRTTSLDALHDRVAVVTGAASRGSAAHRDRRSPRGRGRRDRRPVAERQAAAPMTRIQRRGGAAAAISATDVSDQVEQVKANGPSALTAVRPSRHPGQQRRHFQPSLCRELTAGGLGSCRQRNLRGSFLCTERLTGRMLERGDGDHQRRLPARPDRRHRDGALCSASKAGVIGLTKALAREVSRQGCARQRDRARPDPDRHDGSRRPRSGRTTKLAELPIGRFGEVHEVAPTAVFLASDDSSYYVGQTLGPTAAT